MLAVPLRQVPCPGNPTHEHEFADPNKWKQCGEVFTIYAYSKQKSEQIVNKDAVMLLFGWDRWVSVQKGLANTDIPPGKALPLQKRTYDRCGGEAFKNFKA